MHNKVNEWQELSLKKDIEKILKSISRKEQFDLTLIIDVSLACFTIVSDIIIKEYEYYRFKWILSILFVICLLVTIYLIYCVLHEKIKNHNTTYEMYSPSELIDMFDNEVCYYAMMALTYSHMFQDVTKEANSDDIATFYCIETYYYINKTKAKLSKMIMKVRSVFTSNSSALPRGGRKAKINIERLTNIINIIEKINTSLQSNDLAKRIIESNQFINAVNQTYEKDLFISFKKEINSAFGTKL